MSDTTNIVTKSQRKKRGRKPKGGKIISKELTVTPEFEYKPNVIIQLNCSSKDIKQQKYNNLKYDPNINDVIASNAYDNSYTNVDNINNIIFNTKEYDSDKLKINDTNSYCKDYNNKSMIHNLNIQDYKNMINNINKQFSNNNIINSDCFWCCHPFNAPPIHIPKNYINEKYNVYGHFCSIECACGYLFNEKINMSEKNERFMWINFIYNDILKGEDINPAPSPYYLLSKFCGNMEIEEFRNIYTTNHTINYINKPNSLNIEYPELYLHLDKDNSVYNYDAKAGSGFKIKKGSKKKNNVMTSYFNL